MLYWCFCCEACCKVKQGSIFNTDTPRATLKGRRGQILRPRVTKIKELIRPVTCFLSSAVALNSPVTPKPQLIKQLLTTFFLWGLDSIPLLILLATTETFMGKHRVPWPKVLARPAHSASLYALIPRDKPAWVLPKVTTKSLWNLRAWKSWTKL